MRGNKCIEECEIRLERKHIYTYLNPMLYNQIIYRRDNLLTSVSPIYKLRCQQEVNETGTSSSFPHLYPRSDQRPTDIIALIQIGELSGLRSTLTYLSWLKRENAGSAAESLALRKFLPVRFRCTSICQDSGGLLYPILETPSTTKVTYLTF